MRFRNYRKFMIVSLGFLLVFSICPFSVSADDPAEIITMSVSIDPPECGSDSETPPQTWLSMESEDDWF